jgi:hypothetical protein
MLEVLGPAEVQVPISFGSLKKGKIKVRDVSHRQKQQVSCAEGKNNKNEG